MDNEDIQDKKEASASGTNAAAGSDAEAASAPEFMEPEETGMLSEQSLDAGDATDPGAAPGPSGSDDFQRELQEVEDLRARVAQLEKDLLDEKEHKLRILADFDNLRKRSARDIQNAAAKATSDVVVEFLPVFDHLEMAIGHAQEHGGSDGLVEGVNMVLKQFRNTLSKFGIQEIDALGQPFDPSLHEAMAKAPCDEFAAGVVSKQWQKGFMLGERLIRPCRVVVSTGPGPQGNETTSPAPLSEEKADASESTVPDLENPR